MTFIQNATGHSAKKETTIARVLYISIGLAILAGIIFFLLLGQKSNLNPFKSSDPRMNAPSETP